MAHYVLVHGMFHGGWCWSPLKAHLEHAGHTVTAPDLAGCGSDRTPAGTVTLERWANDIAAIVARAQKPVILVGHSCGGIAISQATELCSNRIAALVYLTAVMVPSGSAATSIPQITAEEGFEVKPPPFAMNLTDDQLAFLPPRNAGDLFYAECTSEVRAWALPQLSPDPSIPLGTPLALSASKWGSIPRIYIVTSRDRVLDVGAQRAMIARTGADDTIVIETDHMPILSHVPRLAGILEGIDSRHARRRS